MEERMTRECVTNRREGRAERRRVMGKKGGEEGEEGKCVM